MFDVFGSEAWGTSVGVSSCKSRDGHLECGDATGSNYPTSRSSHFDRKSRLLPMSDLALFRSRPEYCFPEHYLPSEYPIPSCSTLYRILALLHIIQCDNDVSLGEM